MTDPAVAAGPNTHDRALGALIGVALGDALGMPSELWPRQRVQRHFGEITGFLPGPDGHFIVDGFQAGQVTDDTQQTVMLAQAIIEADGHVDPDVVARHLVDWATRIGATGGNFLGPSSRRAIEALRSGVPVGESGARGDTNGAAMRIVPVGVLCPYHDLTSLVDAVEAACKPSHFTDIAIAGASMVAAAVSRAVDGASLDQSLAFALDAADAGMTRGNATPGASLRRRTEWGLERVARNGSERAVLDDLYDFLGAGVATTEAVPTALSLVALADGEPVRAGLLAANLGGDTDTIGAMAVGVCGALAGATAIPADHRNMLEQVNNLDLEPLASALVRYREQRSATEAAT